MENQEDKREGEGIETNGECQILTCNHKWLYKFPTYKKQYN
jgi:hypothetical protein